MNTLTNKHDVVSATDASFAELVLESERPVVVDFHGDWIPAWRGLAEATRAELACRFASRVRFAEVKTLENRWLASEHGVELIPNVFIFVGGAIVRQFVGTVATEVLADELEDVLVETTEQSR